MLKAGEAALPVRQTTGDYDRWFLTSWGHEEARFDIRRPYLGERLPASARTYDAVVMTGSPLSVTQPTAWMKQAAEFLLESAEQKVPVLGVCFGHQLLGYACGSRVIRNERGREVGTVEIELTPEGRADPLFEGLPGRFAVQATHEDVVDELPANAVVLAKNENTALQAMAVGPYLRGVQFHPELSPDGMAAVVNARAARLEAEAPEGWAPGERVRSLLSGIRPTPYARRLLFNFLQHFT